MRKVLSFVLVLALVLSSFSMAFAAETTTAATTTAATTSAGLSDIASSANNQAIQVTNNLGIVTGNPDGTFQPEKAVNRAEFAAMITRALGIPTSALAGYTSTSFKDTSGYGWAVPYLAFCQSKGIMLGDGAGNAMPGRTINTNEAATMILRALGYTSNSSALVGVWPSNYVSLAQDLGIYDDTAKIANVDKQNAAQMIYNALTVQKVQVAADGTTNQLKDKNNVATTMLTSGLGCTNEGYKVVTYDADAVINTVPYIGDYAKIYKNSAGDIVAIDDIQGTTIKAKFNDENGNGTVTADGKVTFTDKNDVDYTVKGLTYNPLDDAGKVTNPTNLPGYDKFLNGDDVNSLTFAKDKEYTLNVKLSNKNITEIYSIEDWTPTAASKIVAGDLTSIKDGSLLGSDFATDKNDNIIGKSFELVGVSSLSDIKADNVVYVYEDTDRDEISKVAVGTKAVEGTVTKINKTDKKWTVGGTTYEFAMNGESGSSKFKDTELNSAVKLYLDAYGDIYKYDVTSGSAKDYATVVAYDQGGTSGGNIKIYKADDSKKTYSNDLDNFSAFANTVSPSAIGKRLIGYSLNKNGEIDGTYPKFLKDGTTEWGDNKEDGWYKATAAIMPSNTVLKSVTPLVTNGDSSKTTLVVDPDAVVFTYDNNTTMEVNGVSKISNIEKDKSTPLSKPIEALVRDGKVVAMIVSEDDCNGTSTDSYAVVSDYQKSVNSVGDKALSLTGFIDGKEVKADKDQALTSGEGTLPTVGSTAYTKVNVYKLKYNDDKNISKMEAVVAGGTGKTDVVLNSAIISKDGYPTDNYIRTNSGATVTAISSDANWYEVEYKSNGDVDKYKTFSGTFYPGMKVWAYETNDDKDGADIVIIYKNDVKPSSSDYVEPTLTLGATTNVASNAAIGTQVSGKYTFTKDPNVTVKTVNVTVTNDKNTGVTLVVSDGAIVLAKTLNGTTTGTGIQAAVTLTDSKNTSVTQTFTFNITD